MATSGAHIIPLIDVVRVVLCLADVYLFADALVTEFVSWFYHFAFFEDGPHNIRVGA